MKHALLFRDKLDPILVTADEIKAGLYDRHDEYVDPEYEFKVEYVKGAKHGGGPYFRLYYSYEDYKRVCPERADRYEIVANMRRYAESEWHTRWKVNMSSFCQIEHTIPNRDRGQWKIADAYYAKTKTCIEFQHSYISFHFEEKNEFYRALSLQVVWLYDLSHSNIKQCDDGTIEILEDNSRGFFRISEHVYNLRDNPVYIQVKSGKIYRVTELDRRTTSNELKSTIRRFLPSEIYDEQEFITAIQNNSLKSYEDIVSDRQKAELQRKEQETKRLEQEAERQRKAQALEQQRQQVEKQQKEQESQKKQKESTQKHTEESNSELQNSIRQQIHSANYDQRNEFVIIHSQRYVLCTICNQPKKEQDMPMIGFDSERNPNKGKCRDCLIKKA